MNGIAPQRFGGSLPPSAEVATSMFGGPTLAFGGVTSQKSPENPLGQSEVGQLTGQLRSSADSLHSAFERIEERLASYVQPPTPVPSSAAARAEDAKTSYQSSAAEQMGHTNEALQSLGRRMEMLLHRLCI